MGAGPGRRRRARRHGQRSRCPSATCCWAASRAPASPRRCRCWWPRRRSIRRVGCGCWMASWSSCRCGRRAPSGSPAPTSMRRSRCCGRCARRWRRAIASCSPAASARSARGDGLALHLVVCDELAFYLGAEDRKQRTEFAELLRDLVARGRAAGVIVCAATQKPASDVVPSALRDLFGFRLALRCNTPQASDTILGQGWATRRLQRRDDPARAARRRLPARRGRPARPPARLLPARRADRRDRRTRERAARATPGWPPRPGALS